MAAHRSRVGLSRAASSADVHSAFSQMLTMRTLGEPVYFGRLHWDATMTETFQQYSLRFLFALTTFCCVAIVACRLALDYLPWLFAIGLLISLLSASLGVWFFALTALISLAVYSSPDDKNRSENLKRCQRLLVFGILSVLPAATLIVISRLLPG